MRQDLRYALRSLRKRPGLTAAAVLALGLALGASGTIMSLVDGLWLRPPAVRDANDLVRVFGVTSDTTAASWSYPEFIQLRSATTLRHVVARGRRGTIAADVDGRPALVLVNVVSPDFFSVLGVRPATGRLFGSLDTSPVVVLGHAYWQTRFAGDPRVVGSTLPLGAGGSVNATVIGVLPASFRELEPAADRDIWMPPVTWQRLSSPAEFERRDSRWFDLIGLRRSGVSVASIGAEVNRLTAAMAASYPESGAGRRARVVADADFRMSLGSTNVFALLALVGVVSLITCVNLAELLLAGVAERRREFVTRVALGASRFRLARSLLVEGLLLGVFGAVAGIAVALAFVRLVPAIVVPPPGFRDALVVTVDARVLLFTALTAMVCTLVFSLAPLGVAARADLSGLIKAGTVHGTHGRLLGRAPFGLIVQVALAFVLLAAAGVLGRSFLAARHGHFGLTRAPVLTAWSTSDLPAATRAVAEARLDALPGVTDVAVAIRAPLSLSGGGRADRVRLPSRADAVADVKYNAVSGNYFAVIGTRIVEGRAFSSDEERTGRRVAVVSETFASRYFPTSPTIGARFLFGAAPGEPWEIVGVAEDAVVNAIGETPEPYVYLPFEAIGPGEATFLLALAPGVVPPTREVGEALRQVNASLEPRRVVMLDRYVEYASSDYRATAALAVALGSLGLVLTLVGVYGVTMYRTSRRTREFGIRTALGALRRQVMALVLTEAGVVAALGIALGMLLALWANRLIESLLLRVQPWDPWAFGGAALVLIVALTGAALGPARRASAVNPLEALRDS
ncbi:MAG TPA: ADOP family duplicated permease [Vicinamibacterales bacterium]|nr:ADOP family duplicated permease [Vicinamibacterales bacterium]